MVKQSNIGQTTCWYSIWNYCIVHYITWFNPQSQSKARVLWITRQKHQYKRSSGLHHHSCRFTSSPGLNSLWWCFTAGGRCRTWIGMTSFQRVVRRNSPSWLPAPEVSTAHTCRYCCSLTACLKRESRPFSIANQKLTMIAFCLWRRWGLQLQRTWRIWSHIDRLQNTNRWWRCSRNLVAKRIVQRELIFCKRKNSLSQIF